MTDAPGHRPGSTCLIVLLVTSALLTGCSDDTPDTTATFKQIKATFDPELRINDAKKIPSDRSFVELVHPVAANVPGGAM